MLFPFHANPDSIVSCALMQTFDRITIIGNIFFNGQRPKKDWFIRQERKSPAYSNCWEGFPVVKIY